MNGLSSVVLVSPSVSNFFPQIQKSFIPVLSKRVYQVSLRTRGKSAQRETCKAWKSIRWKTFKTRFGCFLFKNELQKLQRLYTQAGAAKGSDGNLVKSSSLLVSKVRRFLYSKPSFTNCFPSTSIFKKTKAFARFINEICCLDLAFVGKLANISKELIHSVVHRDLFVLKCTSEMAEKG